MTMRRARYSVFSASVIFLRTRCLGCVEFDRLNTFVMFSRTGGLAELLALATDSTVDSARAKCAGKT